MRDKDFRGEHRSITYPVCVIQLLILTLSGWLLWACGTTSKTDEKPNAENAPSYQCYGYYTDKDSVFLKLTFKDNEVTGDLTYKLYEKDKNKGTLQGVVHGDTLFATYQFTSEGQASVRDVAFLKKGNELVEGFAPMDESGTHFKNRNDLDFTGIVLQPDSCP